MTGVHRPDVSRLIEPHQSSHPQAENIIGRLIGQWQGDPRFRAASGKPRTLSIDGKRSEFAELVESISTALSPYTILFELERCGAVERTKNGIRLAVHQYIQREDLEQAIQYLSRDCDDLIAAIEENVMSQTPNMNLHIQTEYDQVTVCALEVIRRWFIDQGNIFHTKAREFIAKFDKDLNPKINKYEPVTRVSVCTFSRIEGRSLKKLKINKAK